MSKYEETQSITINYLNFQGKQQKKITRILEEKRENSQNVCNFTISIQSPPIRSKQGKLLYSIID